MPAKKKTTKTKKAKKKVIKNPNHLEDFEDLLFKAVKPQKPTRT